MSTGSPSTRKTLKSRIIKQTTISQHCIRKSARRRYDQANFIITGQNYDVVFKLCKTI